MCEKNTLLIKTDEYKYSGVLKAMRSDAKLKDLDIDVYSILRSRTGKMIFDLKYGNTCKSAASKHLTEEVLQEGVEVKALTAEAIVKVKNLNETTDAEEPRLCECEVQLDIAAVRLRKGPTEAQMALLQLPVAGC